MALAIWQFEKMVAQAGVLVMMSCLPDLPLNLFTKVIFIHSLEKQGIDVVDFNPVKYFLVWKFLAI